MGKAQSELEAMIRKLASAFGPEAAGELALLLQRNQVDWRQQERWWGWWLLLNGVATNRRVLPKAVAAAAPRIRSIAAAFLSADVAAVLDRAEREATEIGLPPLELGLLRYRVGDTAEGEAPMVDVIAHMRLAVAREAAFLTYHLLAMVISIAEMQALDRLAVREVRGDAGPK